MKIDTSDFKALAEELLSSIEHTPLGPNMLESFCKNGIFSTKKCHEFGSKLLSLCNAYDEQEKEIERLRDALGFYANEDFHNNGFEVSTIEIDNGDLARRALEGK